MGTGEGEVWLESIYAVWDANGNFMLKMTPDTFTFVIPVVAAALILKRQILRNGFAARLSILYAPKGPLWIGRMNPCELAC